MSKLHVISNCATDGLSRSLSLLCPDLEVGSTEITAAQADHDKTRADLMAASRLVLLPQARQMAQNLIGAQAMADRIVIEVPGFFFAGYHPDCCYVRSSKGYPVNTRFGAYHSRIALVAWRMGLSVPQAAALYTGRTYAAAGYLDAWDKQRQLLVASFATAGIDIAADVLRWSRRGCFMHTVNHPHVACLFDVARALAPRLDTRVVDFPTPPADNLAANAIFPCYPEIAANTGTRGSLLFKLSKRDTVVDLTEFLTLSFFTYDRHQSPDLNLDPGDEARAAALTDWLKQEAAA